VIVVLIAADGIGDQGTYDEILHLDGNANSNAIATYFKALMLGPLYGCKAQLDYLWQRPIGCGGSKAPSPRLPGELCEPLI
jgi:hypothetical protein